VDLADFVFMIGDSMQENHDKEKKEHPIEMMTDEALDYVFGSEIAERLRGEAGKDEPPEDSELED
jgi:hypothetical protein